MKNLVTTVLITTFVLILFSHFGAALKCYQCLGGIGPCKTNITCSGDSDSCILLNFDNGRNISDCWKYSNCEIDFIEKEFKTGNFKFHCCQKDLCNGSPITAGSKLVFGLTSVLIAIQMLCF
ncbi:CD59 glycoprotein-like [Lacerta agilis]|uniref:CD59 glycoprotein-like n=1 Tax=Lacerta agilis TaxID=80427 RepID=UPI001419C2F0|nr:CD59 glycoprotein-like [Lacerta agilis]